MKEQIRMPLNLHLAKISSSIRLLDDKFIRFKACANKMYTRFSQIFVLQSHLQNAIS